jgi:hypothetical protein
MAIYKNREVYVIGPNTMANTPETINIKYKDGTHENVSVGLVRFTADEKKQLIKQYPSKFDDVHIVDDKDLEAVRAGITPPSDPVYKEQARAQVQRDKQKELTDKNMEAAKAEAKKQLDAESKSPLDVDRNPNTVSVVTPTPAESDSKLPWVHQ